VRNSGKIREQIEETLKKGNFEATRSRPNLGWIRSIRMALGMSGKQLAERINVKPPRIVELEKAEVQGNITLRSLQRAAEAMGCDVVYALVPKGNLESILKNQAQKTAQRNLENVAHSMRLEKQGLSEKENTDQMARMVAELWDLK
jgi:predicted DNA-binding mobile mystery protein A